MINLLLMFWFIRGVEPLGSIPPAPARGPASGFSLQFVNNRVGWLVNHAGSIQQTEDGGTSWRLLALPQSSMSIGDQPLRGRLVSSGRGWVLLGRELYVTNDRGNSWSLHARLPGGAATQVQAFESSVTQNDLVAVTETATADGNARLTIIVTHDSGKSWRHRETAGHQFRLVSLDAHSGVVYAAGSKSVLYSLDYGATWRESKFSFAANRSALFTSTLAWPSSLFTARNVAWLVYENGYIFRSEDHGRSWYEVARSTQVWLDNLASAAPSIQFLTPDHGYVVGGDGVLRESHDSGFTWRPIPIGAEIVAISCYAIRSCYAVTATRQFLRIDSIAPGLRRE